jgi:hypothetical protein
MCGCGLSSPHPFAAQFHVGLFKGASSEEPASSDGVVGVLTWLNLVRIPGRTTTNLIHEFG